MLLSGSAVKGALVGNSTEVVFCLPFFPLEWVQKGQGFKFMWVLVVSARKGDLFVGF